MLPADANMEGLTRLTRHAKRRPAGRALLHAVLAGRLANLAEIAIEVAIGTGDPIGIVLAERLASEGDLSLWALWERIVELCDEPVRSGSVPLLEVAAIATEKLLSAGAEVMPGSASRARIAGLESNASARFGAQGLRGKALAASQRAVDLFRQLAAEDPGEYLVGYGGSLVNLAVNFRALGRIEQAAEGVREALEIAGRLPDSDGERAVLAAAAYQVSGAILSDRADPAGSEAAYRTSVELYQEALAADPKSRRPELATSLEGWIAALEDLGRRDECLAASRLLADLYEKLAAERSDVFQAGWARSLDLLGRIERESGNLDEALTASQEAVRALGELARERPESYGRDHLFAKENLALLLFRRGEIGAACRLGEEVVVALRSLASEVPSRFLPPLAAALGNLSNYLSRRGMYDKAWDAAEEAVALFRQLAADQPSIYREELAKGLHILAVRAGERAALAEALELTDEATTIFRELAHEIPAAFEGELAGSLHNLANRCEALGLHDRAAEAAAEGVEILDRLAKAERATFLPELATNLGGQARALAHLGFVEEALQIAERALSIRRELARKMPSAHRPELRFSLALRGEILRSSGRIEEAVAAFQELVALDRELVSQGGDLYLEELATDLVNLAGALSVADRQMEALDAGSEAWERLQALYRESPQRFAMPLVVALTNRAQVTAKCGLVHDSLAYSVAGIRLASLHFSGSPETVAEPLTALVRLYLRAIEAVGVAPDEDLLAPVLEMFHFAGVEADGSS